MPVKTLKHAAETKELATPAAETVPRHESAHDGSGALRRFMVSGTAQDDTPAFIGPKAFAKVANISIPFVYKLLAEKRIKSRRVGAKILIPTAAAVAFLQGDEDV